MYAAKAAAVNSNPVTQAAIRRQLVKQGLLKGPPTQEEINRKKQEELERKWEESALQIERMDEARQRDMGPHTMAYIARWVCLTHGVTIEQLKGYRRDRYIVLARKQFVFWAYRLTPCSYPRIAKWLNKDHTTALHAAKTYKKSKKERGTWLRKRRAR
jgi:chromosomal replication initiation ATPase DnaA